MLYNQTPTTHPTDELPPLYIVQQTMHLPEAVHAIHCTAEMPAGVYLMIELSCVEEALLFTGSEAYLMKSVVLADQWYLFIPMREALL